MPWIVVGLGNPGPDYAGTRHNVGAMVIEELARREGARLSAQRRTRCDVVEGRMREQRIVLAVPQSYMNESGGPVNALVGFHKSEPSHLIVIHDELDIPFASLRVKLGGGDNGHNGLRSIRSAIKTGDFLRVRVGIGRPPGRQDPADFVLKPFSAEQRRELPLLLSRAADAVESVVVEGLERTQNAFHEREATS